MREAYNIGLSKNNKHEKKGLDWLVGFGRQPGNLAKSGEIGTYAIDFFYRLMYCNTIIISIGVVYEICNNFTQISNRYTP